MKNVAIFNKFTTALKQNGYEGATTDYNGYLGFFYYKKDTKDPNNIYIVHSGDVMYNDAVVSLKKMKYDMQKNAYQFFNSINGSQKQFAMQEAMFILSTINSLI